MRPLPARAPTAGSTGQNDSAASTASSVSLRARPASRGSPSDDCARPPLSRLTWQHHLRRVRHVKKRTTPCDSGNAGNLVAPRLPPSRPERLVYSLGDADGNHRGAVSNEKRIQEDVPERAKKLAFPAAHLAFFVRTRRKISRAAVCKTCGRFLPPPQSQNPLHEKRFFPAVFRENPAQSLRTRAISPINLA